MQRGPDRCGKKIFSEEAKADVTQMVEEFIEVYQRMACLTLDWMSQATKDKAIEKLDAMTLKIGYPDQWDDSMGWSGDHG